MQTPQLNRLLLGNYEMGQFRVKCKNVLTQVTPSSLQMIDVMDNGIISGFDHYFLLEHPNKFYGRISYTSTFQHKYIFYANDLQCTKLDTLMTCLGVRKKILDPSRLVWSRELERIGGLKSPSYSKTD